MSATPSPTGAHPAAAKADGHDAPPKKRRLLKAGLAGTAAILLVGGGTWYLLAPEPVTPTDRLREALQLLDAGELESANDIAKQLEADKFHDEAFPGGVEYVLGMVKYQSIAEAQDAAVTSLKAAAITYLKEAEHQGLADDRQLAWAFVLGACLENVGQPTAAQPLLEEVAAAEGPHRLTAAGILIDLYLDPSWANPQRLARALELSELQRKAVEPKTPAAEAAVLQHAAVRLALNQLTEAETAITEAGLDARSSGVLLLRGRILLAAERWTETIALLEKIPTSEAATGNAYRPALYLMGVAAERQAMKLAQVAGEGMMQRTHLAADRDEYRQRAVEYYRKVTNQFPDSDEALAAEIAFGRLEQSSGAHEKALQLYGSALRAANRSDDFRNRWLSLDTFRERVREAWADWLEAERFAEAIALADLMTPVFPRDQAYELSAMAYRGWADKSDKEFTTASATERGQRTESLRQLFGDTGAAYDRLAQAHRSQEHAREAMWLSAEFYRRGHSFETALASLERFLQESSTAMHPVALVRKGQILLDLDRVADAEASFQEVLKAYPTSAAVFQAQHLLGVCRLEQDDPQGAADQWQGILTTDRLTPAAVEWRDTLFALARLHTESAAWSRRQLERPEVSATETERLWTDVSNKASEAARLFYEYVLRYPQSKAVAEARYHLAKSLQLLGDCRHREWQTAETGNSREQSRKELNDVLEQALVQLQTLRDDLTVEFQNDQLDPIRRQIWENVWFELPHTLFALRRYEDAITAYSSAMHRFPQDVRVLTAHVQMAYAYAQLDRLIEARSLLEQAKVILAQNQIPAAAFQAPTTNLTPAEWEQWLNRVRQVYR